MKFLNHIFYLSIAPLFGALIKHLSCKQHLLNKLEFCQILVILFTISVWFDITARETSIIFKGQAVKFEKTPGSNGYPELHGNINGKEVIATTDKYYRKKNKYYLGAFRKLNNKHHESDKKKLVIYHVFEKQ